MAVDTDGGDYLGGGGGGGAGSTSYTSCCWCRQLECAWQCLCSACVHVFSWVALDCDF